MKKMTMVLMALVLLAASAGSCYAEAAVLPDALQTIEEEAWMNTALEGLLRLPGTVTSIGKNVFHNTALYALEVPAGVTEIGDQGLEGQAVAYALLKGESTPAAGLKGVHYLFYAGTEAPADAPEDAVALPADQLITDGLFYYFVLNGGTDEAAAILLCAVNNLAVPAQVTVPDCAAGIPVTGIAKDAFIGCAHVTDVSLPENAEAAQNAFASCPGANVTYRSSGNVIQIWVAERAVELTEALLSAFWDAHPEYSDWSFAVTAMSESDAAGEVLSAPVGSVDVYGFAQDQLAALAYGGALDAPGAAAAAEILSANDAGAAESSRLGDQVYAYPITSDNGYFLYYDKSVITNPGSLEAILADCEKSGRTFCAELTSGWYNVMFFFGAGCDLKYSVNADGVFTSFDSSLANENGLKALKAMLYTAQSPAFLNLSSANEETGMAALVSGTWDAWNVQELLGANAAAAKLPTCAGMQLGSFGGYKLLGVRNNGNPQRLALAHSIAAYLSGEEAQIARQNNLGWIASRPAARAQANSFWYTQALAAQSAYAVPQQQYPGAYWGVAEAFGRQVITGELDGMTDTELMNVLSQYEAGLAASVQ